MELTSEPKIIWTKVKCPMCNEPTGAKSQCYNLSLPNPIPNHKKIYNHPKLGLLSVFNENCYWRSKNLWRFDVNKTLDGKFLKSLSELEGIESIEEINPHFVVIAIGRLYEEKDVKFKINSLFRNIVKTSTNIFIPKNIDLEEEIIGISFPNGKSFIMKSNDESQKNYIKILLEEIPNSAKIVRKDNQKNV